MTAGYDRAGYLMYLAQVPMFSACSSQELDELAAFGQARQVRPGTDLVREGEAGHEFFVIATGKATVTRDGTSVGSLGPGSFFGELALFDPAPRNATVTADTPLTAITLARDAFEAVLGDSPSIRDAVLRGMAHRLHELDGTA